MHRLDLYHHTIIGYEFRELLLFRLQELDLYHHTIIGYEFRDVVFLQLQ